MAAAPIPTVDDDQRLRDLQRAYVELLDDSTGDGRFSNLVKQMIEQEKPRLVLNINDIRSKSAERAKGILNNFFEEMTAFQRYFSIRSSKQTPCQSILCFQSFERIYWLKQS